MTTTTPGGVMPTPNEVSTRDKLVVPDHENPAWLRTQAAREEHTYHDAPTAKALRLLADILDVCGRDDVRVRVVTHPATGRYHIYHKGRFGVEGHGPTLPAAVRAFLAAEQEAPAVKAAPVPASPVIIVPDYVCRPTLVAIRRGDTECAHEWTTHETDSDVYWYCTKCPASYAAEMVERSPTTEQEAAT